MNRPEGAGAERTAEVAEAEAAGSVAAVYADIRRVLGVPLVALVYRVLASRPGRVEAIWAELAPNLGSEVVRHGAPALGSHGDRAVASLRLPSAEGAARDRAAAAATLRAFRHTNSVNVIGLTALREGVAGPTARVPAPSAPAVVREVLPMADLEALPASTVRLLERMSEPIAGGERPLVIPSLFRYFAHDERLLTLIWGVLEPFVGGRGFAAATAAVRAEAGKLATVLPHRVTRVDDTETRAVVERFLRTIPAMIVTGSLIEALLARPAPGETG